MYGNPVFYKVCRASAFLAAVSAPGFCTWEIVAPCAVVGAGELGIDEAVDRLVADDMGTSVTFQTASDLFG